MRLASKVIPYYDENGYDTIIAEQNDDNELLLLGVFDGMGVSEASRFASAAGVETFKEDELPTSVEALAQRMVKLVQTVSTKPEGGTTATVAVVGNYINYVHVGDTRLYVLYKGRVKQITADEGIGNMLLNYVGAHSNGLNQAGTIQQWDRIMLCSDGVTGDWPGQLVTDQQIEKALSEATTPEQAVEDILVLSSKKDDKSIIVAFKDEGIV